MNWHKIMNFFCRPVCANINDPPASDQTCAHMPDGA